MRRLQAPPRAAPPCKSRSARPCSRCSSARLGGIDGNIVHGRPAGRQSTRCGARHHNTHRTHCITDRMDSQEPQNASSDEAMTVAACASLLKEKFPALFAGKPKPLKLRIQVDIQARCPDTFPKQTLSAFLRRYTMSDAYLRAVSTGTHRYDLDGNPAGELSEEHRQVAQQTLAQRRARHEERRAQEQAERAQAHAQRNFRAALLRDYEGTTLTRENFCALKGVDPNQLDALLETARQEREQRKQFLAELLASYKASGLSVAAFAEQRRMHPVQLERLLREASPPPQPRPRGPRRDEPRRPGGKGRK
ncbi:prop effector ProQ [Caldimonas thermodepolymerans]|uniref:Prop effector ProQ n=2 Tax=Caldimonas thermodepolymerans TaxID=215580 RepID=A0A2S5T9D8_9BURK|nr:prop effector ProQ [Caldimonas thermodepolymerans]